MEQVQELPRIEAVGRRHGIRFDRGRLPASGGGALSPPSNPGLIQADHTTGIVQVDLVTGVIQVSL